MQMALGSLSPVHLTFRDVIISEKPWYTQTVAPGFSFTLDFGTHLLSKWIDKESPTLEWNNAIPPLERRRASADVGRAILGLLQLTLEGHIVCKDPSKSGQYVPKYAASAIWEYAERGIRHLGPRIGCLGANRRRSMCPNLDMTCLRGPNAADIGIILGLRAGQPGEQGPTAGLAL